MNFEIEYIKKLIGVLSDNNLSEISIEDKDEKTDAKQSITIKRSGVQNESTFHAPKVQEVENNEDDEEKNPSDNEYGKAVLSPVTGTFYASSSPNAEPFVHVGEIVCEGQILCIVEAMKLMNEIEAEVAGKITKICVQDGEMVESGQALMYIE